MNKTWMFFLPGLFLLSHLHCPSGASISSSSPSSNSASARFSDPVTKEQIVQYQALSPEERITYWENEFKQGLALDEWYKKLDALWPGGVEPDSGYDVVFAKEGAETIYRKFHPNRHMSGRKVEMNKRIQEVVLSFFEELKNADRHQGQAARAVRVGFKIRENDSLRYAMIMDVNSLLNDADKKLCPSGTVIFVTLTPVSQSLSGKPAMEKSPQTDAPESEG